MRLSRRQPLFQLARRGLGKLIGLLLRLEAKLRQLLGEDGLAKPAPWSPRPSRPRSMPRPSTGHASGARWFTSMRTISFPTRA